MRLPLTSQRRSFGALPLDALTRTTFFEQVAECFARGEGASVFTPNVDHVVRAEDDPAFRAAYVGTSFSLADGMPLLWVSRAAARPLPEKLSGSDLFWPLIEQAARSSVPVYLLGGRPGAALRVAELARTRVPSAIVHVSRETRILLAEPKTLAQAVTEISALGSALILVSLPSPQQELWTRESMPVAPKAVFACLGSAVDIAAGLVERAPRWMQNTGLEWAYRIASEPQRLWRRYAVGLVRFAPIAAREMRRRGKA